MFIALNRTSFKFSYNIIKPWRKFLCQRLLRSNYSNTPSHPIWTPPAASKSGRLDQKRLHLPLFPTKLKPDVKMKHHWDTETSCMVFYLCSGDLKGHAQYWDFIIWRVARRSARNFPDVSSFWSSQGRHSDSGCGDEEGHRRRKTVTGQRNMRADWRSSNLYKLSYINDLLSAV